MSQRQPGIVQEMAGRLRDSEPDMRYAAAGVLAVQLGVASNPETALNELFRAFPKDGYTITHVVVELEALRMQRRWTVQKIKRRCIEIVRDQRSDLEAGLTAQAVLMAVDEYYRLTSKDYSSPKPKWHFWKR